MKFLRFSPRFFGCMKRLFTGYNTIINAKMGIPCTHLTGKMSNVQFGKEEKMLNRRESEVMNAVYALCKERGNCLVSPTEILALLPRKQRCTEEKLEKILYELEMDDYFEMLSSDCRGEKMYVITLHADGRAFKRCAVQKRRDFAARVAWAVTSAVIAFLVGLLMKWIF